MPIDFSVPIEGLRAAERSLSEAAHKVSTTGLSGISPSMPAPSEDSPSWAMNVDFQAALLQADQAKIAAQANLVVLSEEQKLTKHILNVFG